MRWLILTAAILWCYPLLAQPVNDSLQQLFYRNNKLQLKKGKTEKHFSISPTRFNYYIAQQPFFCRQEMKLEKITSVPIRIRIGDVNDCNYLEQKAGYTFR